MNFRDIGIFDWYLIGYVICVIRWTWLALVKNSNHEDEENLKEYLFTFLLIALMCIAYPLYLFWSIFKVILIIMGFYDAENGEKDQ